MKRILIGKAFPIFEKELLDELNVKGILQQYKKNERLVTIGQPINTTFIILQGCVKVCREDQGIREFVITYLMAGESFAVSISDDSAAADKVSLMTISATEPTYVLLLSFEDKDLLAWKFRSWYKYILQTSISYHVLYLELIDNIAFAKLDQRIAFFLLRLSKTKRSNTLRISHQEIAKGLNASREAVSRLLKKMEESGRIKLMHNMIDISNLRDL